MSKIVGIKFWKPLENTSKKIGTKLTEHCWNSNLLTFIWIYFRMNMFRLPINIHDAIDEIQCLYI